MIKYKSRGQRTKERILDAGVQLWPDVSISKVARAVDMAHGAILYHFPTVHLRDAIAQHAVKTGNSRVIVQLIAERHPSIARMSRSERNAHFMNI